jgi:hypothetical protein
VPRIGYSEDYSDSSTPDSFPRLKLMKDERKRILAFEPPYMEWVHELRLPKIVDGVPVMERKKRQDGSTFDVWDKEFLGNPLCLGDGTLLQEKGLDPVNCPACERSQTCADIPPPKRRYAMNVAAYNMTSNGQQLVQPFGAQVLIWAFTAKIYDMLRRYQEEWKDLRYHDLKLGPLEENIPVAFQRFPIEVAQEAAWTISPETRATFIQIISEANRATDEQLRYACGRPTTLAYMTADVDRVQAAWAAAKSPVNAAAAPQAGAAAFAGQQTLQQDFAGLLQQPQAAPVMQPGLVPVTQPAPQLVPQMVPQPVAAQADPFAPQPGAYVAPPAVPQMHPLEAQAAAASLARQADPFAAMQPAGATAVNLSAANAPVADPFAGIQPVQSAAPAAQPYEPSGMDVFAPQQPQAAPAQPGFQQPQAVQEVNFDDLFNNAGLNPSQ